MTGQISRPGNPRADRELVELLAEIPKWDNKRLTYMHRRFTESRLFRVHHNPEGPLTPRAQKLLNAARFEMEVRGLLTRHPEPLAESQAADAPAQL
ncbi:hypothetical protein [Pelagibacterium montanilacus]|uniref:hypothetical protein n=1 Tax=Pelagibacterium montanilacus TaxID=2185280 RepID=UPI000F8EE585|nr:hypothetical protein [Pelagibacterium montanilacus]